MSDSEIMESLNIIEKEAEKYVIFSVHQDFDNVNMIKRILMALDTTQNFKTKKPTKRRKRRGYNMNTYRKKRFTNHLKNN